MTDTFTKDMVEPEWERPKQSARAAGVGISTIYNEIARGRLDARKFGRSTLISVASRRALFESLPKAKLSRPSQTSRKLRTG